MIKSDKIAVGLRWFSLAKNKLILNKVELKNTLINFVIYKGEKDLNLKFLIDFFSSKDTTKSPPGKQFWLKSRTVLLENTHFRMVDENAPDQDYGMNYQKIDIDKININIKDFEMRGDTFTADIRYLSAFEKSGFKLYYFSTQAKVSPKEMTCNNLKIITPNSNLDLDLSFRYDGFNSYNDFVNKVTIISTINHSKLNFLDISYFAPDIKEMDDIIFVKSKVKGTVNNLKAKQMTFTFNKNTYFEGDISINGLPDIKETFFNVSLKSFYTTLVDIEALKIPGTKIKLDESLTRLGIINLKGFFTGFYNDFVARATLKTSIGIVSTDITLKNNKATNIISYNGKVSTTNLDIGTLLDKKDLFGLVTMDGNIIGKGFTTETADFSLKANINQFGFNKYNYSNIVVDGNYSGKIYSGDIDINDPNIILDFKGKVNFIDSLPEFNFIAELKHVYPYKLNIIPNDSIFNLSTSLKFDFIGNDIDNIEGRIELKNSNYIDGKRNINVKNIKLITSIDNDQYRKFNLTSDFFDANINGHFIFNELPKAFNKYVATYLPGIFIDKSKLDSVNSKQNFNFSLTLHNAHPLLKYFVADINPSKNTKFWGDFNAGKNSFSLNGESQEITLFGNKIENFSFSSSTTNKYIDIDINSDTVYLSDSVTIINLDISSLINNDSVKYIIGWDNKKEDESYTGNLTGFLKIDKNSKFQLGIGSDKLIFGDTLWQIKPFCKINFDTSSIKIDDLHILTRNQDLNIHGTVSKNPDDDLQISFNKFNISHVDVLTNMQGVDFNGYIDGDINISNLYGSPMFSTDLSVKDFAFNNNLMGDLILISKWDDFKKGININATINKKGLINDKNDPRITHDTIVIPLGVKGYYYPNNKLNNFDLNISLSNFNLTSLSRYISDIGAIEMGRGYGNFTLTGQNSSPVFKGKLALNRTLLKINYLNTRISLADTVFFDRNLIYFNKIRVLDQPTLSQAERGKKAPNDTLIANGKITHNYFKDFKYNINLFPHDFLCLNTNPSINESFYGTAYATGFANISGDDNIIKINIDAKTNKGTKLFIPITSSSTVAENDFITFINKGSVIVPINKTQNLSGLQMDFSFDVTQDAEVQMVFDPKMGDRIRAKGNGNIKLGIDSRGNFSIFGDYNLIEGDYNFSFQNIINRKFYIVNGGTIKFNGNPYDAELDIWAVYSLKASPSGLGQGASVSDSSNIPVDCYINITGKLSAPSFAFEIDFPDLPQIKKDQYLGLINQDINKEFLSLLILRSFVPPSGGEAGKNQINYTGQTLSNMLSASLNNWLSQITNKVDIGFNYNPGDKVTQQQVEVALSTQLFNDRVKIDGNFGYGGGQVSSSSQNNNQIIGDLKVEVKITDELKAKVYNKSNQTDLINNYGPYTQGIGILYRKEFDNLKDLFKRKRKTTK